MVGVKHTSEDLATMQSWSLSRKVQVTQARIIEWHKRNNGNVYVSFSGGKDSTVLLDIARKLYPDIPAVFCDTGLEYPEIREFVKSYDNVVWLKPEMNFRKVIETYGYPVISKETSQKIYEARHTKSDKLRNQRLYGDGRKRSKIPDRWVFLTEAPFEVSHKCCDVMKKRPFHKYEKETGRLPIIATMTDESMLRRQSWIRYGCNGFDMKRQTSRPMSFWTESDVLGYLKSFDIPYCPVYGDIVEDNRTKKMKTTGCERTGCLFCMYGCHMDSQPNRFQRMADTHPVLWEYCMKPWEDGGLGMRSVLDYIGVKGDNQERQVYRD